jgi:hypothetical protein
LVGWAHHACRFNSVRFPVKPSDTATKFDPTTNNHVVFVRKNRFFEFDVTGMSTADLTAQLQQIRQQNPPVLWEYRFARERSLNSRITRLTLERSRAITSAREQGICARSVLPSTNEQ